MFASRHWIPTISDDKLKKMRKCLANVNHNKAAEEVYETLKLHNITKLHNK